MRIRLKYVKEYRDRTGRMRRYFRRRGFPAVALPGRPGSIEFQTAYNAALAAGQVEVGTKRTKPETFGAAVVAYYQDQSFLALAESTRRMRWRILEKIRRQHGDKPLRGLQRGHIVSAYLSQLPPFERNNWIKTLRGLMKFALDVELVDSDPTLGIKKSKAQAGTIHTWDESEIGQFEARHGIGSMPRLALALLLYTAQRRSDVVKMGPQHVRDGVLYVRQKKTKMEKEDRVLAIPVVPELAEIIAATPIGNLAFLVTQTGVPFTEKGFGTRFGEWCEQAGLPDRCSAHGLRKAGLVRLAEAGCTEVELRAISGHKNLAELKPYIEKVEQRRLAASAMEKGRTNREQRGANPARIRTPDENVAETKVSNDRKIV